MKQSSIKPFAFGPIPSPLALQVKIFTHLISVGTSGLYFASSAREWYAEFAIVIPSSLV